VRAGGKYSTVSLCDRAIQDFDQAIRLDRNAAPAFNGRCFARAIVNRLQEAVADCNESVRLRPGDADMLGNRGLAYLKMKKLDLALPTMKRRCGPILRMHSHCTAAASQSG
jgi:tetratricopeptide (TPR) repeat protein